MKNKGKTEKLEKTNVVYRLKCKDCSVTYLGETNRQHKVRLLEYKNNMNTLSQAKSVITKHRQNTDYAFDWNNIEILDNESIWSKRIFSEVLHVNLQKNAINKKEDTKNLHSSYIHLLNNLKV